MSLLLTLIEIKLKTYVGRTGEGVAVFENVKRKSYCRLFLGECEVCQKDTGLAVDHDKETGLIRGLVCDSCNVQVGFYERMKKGRLTRDGIYSKLSNDLRQKIEEYLRNPSLLKFEIPYEKDKLLIYAITRAIF